ncbi:hypothetical protein J2X45_003947 [Caulobacter sp. BE264]|uniref:hypothetical protein n=1 Tax=Caulobacter sp. BE264 TaxID=2817724 RepID=UPI002858CFDC|nr:hypothetical protein [Caulobacter sp. BE264]MDR7232837.1 hypothetical protein [Caulobacter sp. BE264]
MNELRFDRDESGEIIATVRTLTAEEIAAIEAANAAIRRTLPKSTVTGRLIEMGKAAEVKAALDADPVAWARWFTPDWPNVFADDEGLLAFLDALGLTSEQIATVTA